MNNNWTLMVEEDLDTGDLIIQLPEDLLQKTGWKESDVLECQVCPETHNIIVRKAVNFDEHA